MTTALLNRWRAMVSSTGATRDAPTKINKAGLPLVTLTQVTSGSPAFLKSLQDPRLSAPVLRQVRLFIVLILNE